MKLFNIIALGAPILAAMLTIGCANPSGTTTSAPIHETSAVEIEKYVYFDNQYEISYEVDGKNAKMIDGPDNAAVAELMKNPSSGLVKDPKDSNMFWIYKDTNEAKTVADLIKSKNGLKKTIASANFGGSYVILYEHDNYGGRSLKVSGSSTYLGWFNDLTSSLYIRNGDISFCEDANFNGHSLTILCIYEASSTAGAAYSYTFNQIPSLRSYTMISRWYWSNTSWNDQISSLIPFWGRI